MPGAAPPPHRLPLGRKTNAAVAHMQQRMGGRCVGQPRGVGRSDSLEDLCLIPLAEPCCAATWLVSNPYEGASTRLLTSITGRRPHGEAPETGARPLEPLLAAPNLPAHRWALGRSLAGPTLTRCDHLERPVERACSRSCRPAPDGERALVQQSHNASKEASRTIW